MRAVAAILCLAAGGCAVLSPKPVVENRFRSMTTTPGPGTAPAVTIGVTSGLAERESGAIKITQLSDRGQAALITATGGKPPVALKGERGERGAVLLDDTITRHLKVTIRPVEFLEPGDRIDAIRVRLAVAEGQAGSWRITGWTFASNGKTEIEVGKLTDASETKLGASTGLGLGPGLPDAKIEAEATRSVSREMAIKDTTEFHPSVDQNGNAWLEETAGWRENLAHNLDMDTVLSAPFDALEPHVIAVASKLTREDAKQPGIALPALPAQVHLSETTIYTHRLSHLPICGYAELAYRIRHITGAAPRGSFSESDDDVAFQTGTAETRFLLAPAPFSPTYKLVTLNQRVLGYAPKGGLRSAFIFASLEEATAFRNWLRAVAPKGGQLGNARVGTEAAGGFRALTASELENLVPLVADTVNYEATVRNEDLCFRGAPPPRIEPVKMGD